MSVRSIVTFPDPRLREVAAPATAFDDALCSLARLAHRLRPRTLEIAFGVLLLLAAARFLASVFGWID